MRTAISIPAFVLTSCLGVASSASAATVASAVMTVSAVIEPSCQLDAGPLTFLGGTSARASSDASAAIRVQCTPDTAFTVTLDDGRNPNGHTRRMSGMASGTFLPYEIYVDAGRTRAWSSGPAGALSLTSPKTGEPVTLAAYGRVLAREAQADRYADEIAVTVSF